MRLSGRESVSERHTSDYTLLAVVGALVALGLVMVYSASFVDAFQNHGTQFYYLIRQLIGTVVGTVGLLVAWKLDYTIWRRYSIHLMVLTIGLLILVLVLPTSMTEVNGSRSWIRFQGGLFSMQPSEVAKLTMVIYFANWLSRRGAKVGNVLYGVVPFTLMLGVVCGLVFWQPDLGTMMVLLLIAGMVYFAAGANLWHVLLALGLGSGFIWLFIELVGYQNGRIKAFINPWDYYDSFGYQPLHSLYALGSGGLFGMGLGQARQKFQWLPQAHTDSIFAILGEELGLIGTLLVVMAFLFIAYRGYRIACRTTDPFASLMAVGITSWLVFQALINMAVTTSLVPFTGLTLPFISYGSSSLIMCMVGAGILLSISRHTVPRPAEEPRDVPSIRRSPALEFFQATREAVATLPVWGWHRRARLSGTRRRRGTEHTTRRPARRRGGQR
jgi:cell division protein FtsW